VSANAGRAVVRCLDRPHHRRRHVRVVVWALDEAGPPTAQHGLMVFKIKLSEAKANDGEREEW
jgi:hypothetical protein